MARAPKAICAQCEAKMAPGLSFCPSCSSPTEWCSHDERVQWEVLQYRKLREKPVGVQATVAPMPARRSAQPSAAPPALIRPRTKTTKPVTVEIVPRFGAAAVAAGVEPVKMPRRRTAAAAAAPVSIETPAMPEPEETAPQLRTVEETDKPRKRKPRAPRASVESHLAPVPDKPSEAAKAKQAKASRRVEKKADMELSVSKGADKRPTVQNYLGDMVGLLEELNRRVQSLETRLTEIHGVLEPRPQPAPAKPRKRRLLGR